MYQIKRYNRQIFMIKFINFLCCVHFWIFLTFFSASYYFGHFLVLIKNPQDVLICFILIDRLFGACLKNVTIEISPFAEAHKSRKKIVVKFSYSHLMEMNNIRCESYFQLFDFTATQIKNSRSKPNVASSFALTWPWFLCFVAHLVRDWVQHSISIILHN